MAYPIVSIIINNYNYGRFLGRAIDSALNQTYPYCEIIVVDDGSTDNSRDIIRNYTDDIIPVFKENHGQASAFNAGYAVSKGDIICFLDSDDNFLPQKVEKIVEIFKANKDIGWCFHSLMLVDSNKKELMKSDRNLSSCIWDFRLQIRRGNLPFIPSATSALCFRRDILKTILPMPEAIRITSDNYLKFIASALSKGFFLDEALTIQNIHENNALTLNDKQIYLKARILILTAYCIKSEFSFLSKFSDKLLITGNGIYWCIRKVDPESKEFVKKYFSSLGIFIRLIFRLRTFCFFFKNFAKIRSYANV
ncbi:glycosyltransferase family 2 protein [Altericista sp. CCNU0014]|uniref:glycosyltransferase family 2 protein n=1 Tax=Altericista sp. CCNU0014 TaxID=3082949 RepID=UPI0038500042